MPEAVSRSRPVREGLLACFAAAVEAARPGRAVAEALDRLAPGVTAPWVMALGKAARPMAQTALEVLARRGGTPAGGVVVGLDESPLPPLRVLTGDHPLPGLPSAKAAEALERCCAEVPSGAQVWVLLSGGATSLVAAPVAHLPQADLISSFEQLLRSGADIVSMNLVRKRISRLAGGGLAQRLRHARVLQLVVSDVPGDDLPSIGSGPLVPDASTVAEVLDVVVRYHLESRLPPSVLDHFKAVMTGHWPETPKPGDPAFAQVTSEIIVSNRLAMAAAAGAAVSLGWAASIQDEPLVGEAADLGRRLAARLVATGTGPSPSLLIWGGEPSVTLGSGPTGAGGRAQELALAAAEVLSRSAAAGVVLLAAGTDGRDGPTDAAGAIVDQGTWPRAAAAGTEPARALRHHDSNRPLEAAGDLLRTGPTGTNVMDLVLGWREAGPLREP